MRGAPSKQWLYPLQESGTPLCVEDAQRSVTIFVEHYNNVRLHSAIGYVAPKDKLEGLEEAIFA